MAERNKNATAAERAERNRVFSGHYCHKTECGQPINRDELRMVKRVEFNDAGKAVMMAPFHIRCYSL